MSFLLFLQFRVYTAVEWTALALVIFVYPVLFDMFHRVASTEVRPDMATSVALICSRKTCAVVMTGLYVVATAYLGDLPQLESIQVSIDRYKAQANDWTGSALVKEGLSWTAYYDGLKAYTFSHLGEVNAQWALLVMMIVNYAIFYGTCLALTCFLIPRTGFEQARMVPSSGAAIFTVSAVMTIVLGFIYFQGLASLNHIVASSPRLSEIRGTVEKTTVELIDGEHYQEGTYDKLVEMRRDAAAQVEATVQGFKDEADIFFTTLENEAVEEYLDWYYSLPAEYVRLSKLLVGDLENYMAEKLRESFEQEKWHGEVNSAFDAVLEVDADTRNELEQAARSILAENRVEPVSSDFEIALTSSLDDILNQSFPQDIIGPNYRATAAGVTAGTGSVAAGGISAIIVPKVTAKVVGKSVFKVAAKALSKQVGSLALKVGGGAAVGGVIGSAVPGVGTAIGAVVGGAFVGLTIGVAVDAALLKLEEALSRDDFRSELVTVIREARREFEEEYFGLSN